MVWPILTITEARAQGYKPTGGEYIRYGNQSDSGICGGPFVIKVYSTVKHPTKGYAEAFLREDVVYAGIDVMRGGTEKHAEKQAIADIMQGFREAVRYMQEVQ
jgi:hypothetical protein